MDEETKEKGSEHARLLPISCHKAVANTASESSHAFLWIAESKPGSQLQLVKVDITAIPILGYKVLESEIWNITWNFKTE